MNIFLLSQKSELLFSSNVNLLCIYYKKNVNNQKLFFFTYVCRIGDHSYQTVKNWETYDEGFFISSGKTYTFLGNVA